MKQIVIILAANLVAGGCAQKSISTAPAPMSSLQTEAAISTLRPKPGDIAEFKADPLSTRAHFKDFKVERKDLEDVLHTWHQVSQEHWQHGYSHVAFGDRTGTIKLKDGTAIRWMVKPGGLAILTFQNGTKMYLAKELTSWKKATETKDCTRTRDSQQLMAGDNALKIAEGS